jgi:A/G-specific adenine glycosylase
MTKKRPLPRAARKPEALPSAYERRRFRRKLLAWYAINGRDLPWRWTADPYHILVSEIMLQQTQVDRVAPKYEAFLAQYPSLAALAAAPVEEVVQSWYPLGYNIRPRRLHAIARESVARYGGELPSDSATLLSFKGIGAYTAGAIQNFAFRRPTAILDTNVARVLLRIFIGRGSPKSHAMRKRLWSLAAALVPRRDAFDFNQALMDFGAMVCTARRPLCSACALSGICRAFPFSPENETGG